MVPGVQAIPLEQINFPFTFGSSANFRTETLTFEVIDFLGSYHAILGRPYYAMFMAVPNYTYLKLKIPRPKGVIMVGGSLQQTNLYEQESYNLATVAVRSFELRSIQLATAEATPDSAKGNPRREPSSLPRTTSQFRSTPRMPPRWSKSGLA